MPINYEFKAISKNNNELIQILQTMNPVYVGQDHQIDTYFNVEHGRLKLREGKIENALIHYVREDAAGAKTSNVLLYQHQPNVHLKEILTAALGIKVVVEKNRHIYFVENVKFHFDSLDKLGQFVEVEAIDKDGIRSVEQLKKQCLFFQNLFKIQKEDYVKKSYSDLMIEHQ